MGTANMEMSRDDIITAAHLLEKKCEKEMPHLELEIGDNIISLADGMKTRKVFVVIMRSSKPTALVPAPP